MAQKVDAHTKTGGEQVHTLNKAGSGATLEKAPAVDAIFQELKVRRKHRYIILRVGESLIDVEKVGERTATYLSMKPNLPYIDCRFVLYDQEYDTADRGKQSRLWFINWFPDNASTYNKMAYTSARQKLIESMPGVREVMVRSLDELDRNLNESQEQADDSDIDL